MTERGTIDTASSYGVAGVLAAIVICAGLSGTGFYIAIRGGDVQGGTPFLPNPWNQMLGRVVFGFGALVTLAMAGWALRDAVPLLRR